MGIDYKKKYLKYKNKYLEAKKIYGGASVSDPASSVDDFSTKPLPEKLAELERIIKDITNTSLNRKLRMVLDECKKCSDPQEQEKMIKDLQTELKTLRAANAQLQKGSDVQPVELNPDDAERQEQIDKMKLPEAEATLGDLIDKILQVDPDPMRDEGRKKEMMQALEKKTDKEKLSEVKVLIEKFYNDLNPPAQGGPSSLQASPSLPPPPLPGPPSAQEEYIKSMDDAAFSKLEVGQINQFLEKLSEKQVALLNPIEFEKLDPETLQKMTLEQLTDLTPELAKAFGAKAFGAEVLKMDQETFELVLNKMKFSDRLEKISEIKDSLGGDTDLEDELKNKISKVEDDDKSISKLFEEKKP